MQLEEAKVQFIQTWGSLGSQWGINRTMAQIHALLLISPKSLSTNEIKDALNISMGNANMNLRTLLEWQLVRKELKLGERKDFFVAEKDTWKVAKLIIEQRKKRELEPMKQVLEQLKLVEGEGEDVDAFKERVNDLNNFVHHADDMLERMIHSDSHWLLNTLLKQVMKL